MFCSFGTFRNLFHVLTLFCFRLEEDVSESMDREKSGKEKGKPRLRIKLNLPDQVTVDLFDPRPILPKKILEDM